METNGKMDALIQNLAIIQNIDTENAKNIMNQGIKSLEQNQLDSAGQSSFDITKLNRAQRRKLDKQMKQRGITPLKYSAKEEYKNLSEDTQKSTLFKIMEKIEQKQNEMLKDIKDSEDENDGNN